MGSYIDDFDLKMGNMDERANIKAESAYAWKQSKKGRH
jgi:hypothetical protein